MPTAPTTIYLSLHTGDPGLTGLNEVGAGVGYARQLITLTAPLDSGTDELIENVATATFGPASSVGFGLVTHLGFWTAVTAGNFLNGGVTTNRTVVAGDSYVFAAGEAEFSLR
jgi:hypothetical protein